MEAYMKRFLILIILLAMALPIMAAPIVAGTEGSSELTWGFVVGPDGYRTRWTNMIWTTVVNVDPSNYILFGFTGGNNPSFSSLSLQAFSGNMILDTVLGLPKDVTVKLKFGLDSVAVANAPPSGYAYESQIAYSTGIAATAAVLSTLYGVNVRLAYNPGTSISTFGIPVSPPTFLANVNGSVGPVFLSGGYYSNGNSMDKGKVGAEVAYNQAFGDFGAGFDVEGSYDMNAEAGILGLAIVGNYSWLSIDASTNLTKVTPTNTYGFNYLGIGIEARPDVKLKRFGASLGFDINMDPTVKNVLFRSIDGSVWFKALGPGKLRLGYLWTKTNNGGGDYYAAAALPNGGVYFKYDMSW
jgi:hypothetical protein